MSDLNLTEYLTPKDTAKRLRINVNTLRTYSLLIEKQTKNPAYFERSMTGGRLYSSAQIDIIKRMIKLKKNDGETLNSAISELFSPISKTGVPSSVPNVPNASNEAKTVANILKAQQERIDQQTVKIDELTKIIQQQSDKLDKLTQAIEAQPKKKHWWQF